MNNAPLFLIKVPLRADRLAGVARRRGIPLRQLDEGYLAHCVLSELWQEAAPAPFFLKGQGRCLDAWGYSHSSATELQQHARDFGDPGVIEIIDDLESVSSKEMPIFETGRVARFTVRVCPVVRLSGGGAEVDAFLAKALGDDEPTLREAVYREWFADRVDSVRHGFETLEVRVLGMSRRKLVRRTQGQKRTATFLERPDVQLEGHLRVLDGLAFLRTLATGIGRHRAFGFGAIMLAAPNQTFVEDAVAHAEGTTRS